MATSNVIPGTAQTYDRVGLREGLTDMIWDISPTEQPFVTACGRTEALAVYHEWQTDSLRPSRDNAQVEGDDVPSFEPVDPTVRLGNYTQILREEVIISGTTESVRKAGRRREMAYQIVKAGKEIRLDLERACIGVNTALSAGSPTTPRRLASVLAWLSTNTVHAAGGVDPATDDGRSTRTDAGTTVPYTEAMLKDLLAQIFTNSNQEANLMLVGAKQKQVMSTFEGNAQRTVEARPASLHPAVDTYVHDFGSFIIRPNREMRSRDALLINTSLWKLAWLRPLDDTPLAKTGDAEKRMMIGEVTLEARNEKGSGGIFDLS